MHMITLSICDVPAFLYLIVLKLYVITLPLLLDSNVYILYNASQS